MRDVLPTLKAWREAGHRFALAVVVQTWGSSPRPVGACLGVRSDGLTVGSVSGGCVEGAVTEAGLQALRDGKAAQLDFGALSDAAVWEVGLSCGGRIRVWVTPDPYEHDAWNEAAQLVLANQPCVLISHGGAFFSLGSFEENRESGEADGVFVHVLPPRERLIIVGACHIAIPLVGFAAGLGFETVVIDPRSALVQSERFPVPPDRVIAQWPEEVVPELALDEHSYVVVLSHDPKIDDATLALVLRSPVRYIGALGSRTTQAARRASLLAQGFSDVEVGRIHGPVGLSIGARSPEEIAISILAEIIQVRHA